MTLFGAGGGIAFVLVRFRQMYIREVNWRAGSTLPLGAGLSAPIDTWDMAA